MCLALNVKPPPKNINKCSIIADIKQIQIVRNSVKENTLSDPALVSDEDCKEFITFRGKGWVCEIENEIIGLSIVDMQYRNIWALFLQSAF